MRLVVTVPDANAFNAGWLAYVLGLPKDPPAQLAAADREWWADGWTMGEETASLGATRYVMARQPELARPQFVVEVEP